MDSIKNLISNTEPTVLESLSQSVQEYTGMDIQGEIIVCILVAVLAVIHVASWIILGIKIRVEVRWNSSNQTQLEEVMTRALECPVCWMVMKANIFQCANGHLICRTCYLRREMKNCPVCRKKYNKRAPVRCLFANQMAQILENNS